ncbi:MAG: hypothetical protein HYX79_05940 [Chloroflexi bacterium]|nr:hypothetical protein [Chloroflexota bacterium]
MIATSATLDRKSEVSTFAPDATEKCCHFWMIESPNGPTSKGVCRFCGAEKEFNNSIPYKVIGR